MLLVAVVLKLIGVLFCLVICFLLLVCCCPVWTLKALFRWMKTFFRFFFMSELQSLCLCEGLPQMVQYTFDVALVTYSVVPKVLYRLIKVASNSFGCTRM